MLYRRAFGFFRADLPKLILAGLLLLTNAAAGLLKPWPLALAVDLLGGGIVRLPWSDHLPSVSRNSLILSLAGLTFAIHALQALLQSVQNALVIQAGLKGLSVAREALFSKLLHRSLRSHQNADPGDAVYRASWDVYAFQTFLHKGVFGSSAALVALASMVVVMSRLDPTLTAVTLLSVPLLVLTMRWFGPRMTRLSGLAHKADTDVTSTVQQRMSALQLIQACGQQTRELLEFSTRVRTAHRARWAQHRFELLYLALTALIFGAGLALILGTGAAQVDSGTLSVGGLLVFLAYANQLFEPLNQLSYVGASLSDARAGMSRVFEMLDETPELVDRPNAKIVPLHPQPLSAPRSTILPSPLHPGRIDFEHVSFAYGTNHPVVRDFSESIAPGEHVALIGPSGAGKTTLLLLLSRFFDPSQGQIRIDGTDLRDLQIQSWRAQLSIVPQESTLFRASVRDNIAYGRPEATAEEIRRAAQNAFAHDFIERLPNGYDTVIGEGNVRLSVGEAQRINLARAYVRNTPILLLDEPTSALDRESEDLVIQSLKTASAGRTLIFVTHGQRMLPLADRVITLR